ncbi:MAG: FAD-dependent oxidoreductase [Patescibacteria group bacterium]
MIKYCDVLIIGGGITGAGIFRDCALRGLKVVLVEKNDFGCQTTAASTGLIHGGMRYLTYDAALTEMTCREAGILARIAPHLLANKEFIFPIFPNEGHSIEKFEALLELYDKYQKNKFANSHRRLSKKEALALEPRFSPNLVGALVLEEYATNPAALTLANILGGQSAGGEAIAGLEVFEINRGKDYVSVSAKDRKEREIEIKARIVVNAAGPWAGEAAKLAGLNSVKIRPTKGVHITVSPSPISRSAICQAIDGRYLMLVSENGALRIGTTDDDFYGDLDNLEITRDEVGYLMEAASRTIPAVKESEIVGGSAGVRPTVYSWGGNEDDLSREYKIVDDGNFVSVIGGKMTIYRLMAEKTVDLLCDKLSVKQGLCATAEKSLPFVGMDYRGYLKNKYPARERNYKIFAADDFISEKKIFWRKMKAKANLAKSFLAHYLDKPFKLLESDYEE